MGNDGGSIPLRRELVKEAARNPTTSQLRATTLERLAHAWRTCALSGEPLKQPVVSDALGRLFNKDELIRALLPVDSDVGIEEGQKEKNECLQKSAVKGMKDVVELKFEVEDGTSKEPKWICPVTQKQLDESTKAVYLVPCGHTFAESAVSEVNDERCIQCSQSYASNDVITVLPTDDVDVAHLLLRMKTLEERGLSHSLKKSRKSKKHAHAQAAPDPISSTDSSSHVNGIQNAATASLTAKVLQEQQARNKKRKADKNENIESLYAKNASVKKGRNNDFMSRGFSIPSK